jgi:hypothetical protein
VTRPEVTKAPEHMACPVCGSELTPAQVFAHEATQHAFERMIAVSVPLGARVTSYITMFSPPKTRLTIAKQVKLILQLLPDLERQAITHKGRDWPAPLLAWSAAIEQMEIARAVGRLELPLSGHGYLYAILAGMADKRETASERQRESERRGPPRQDSVTVRGESMPMGQALQQVYGGVDPALAKIDADAQRAAPMPAEIREKLAGLRKPPEGRS